MKYRCTIVEAEAGDAYEVQAPEGFCFEPGLHALVICWDDGWSTTCKADAMREARRQRREYERQLEPCAPECDCRL